MTEDVELRKDRQDRYWQSVKEGEASHFSVKRAICHKANKEKKKKKRIENKIYREKTKEARKGKNRVLENKVYYEKVREKAAHRWIITRRVRELITYWVENFIDVPFVPGSKKVICGMFGG